MSLLSAFLLFAALAAVLAAYNGKGAPDGPRTSAPRAAAVFITLCIVFNATAALKGLQTEWTTAVNTVVLDAQGRLLPPPGRGALLAAQAVFITGLLGAIHRIFGMAAASSPASRPAMAWLVVRMLLEAVTTFALTMALLGGAFACGALAGGAWAQPWRLIKGFLFSWPFLLFVMLPALGRGALWLARKTRLVAGTAGRS